MQKKMFQQATLENYGQAEMPEWDDQLSFQTSML